MENRKINILGTEYRIETHKVSEDSYLEKNKLAGYCGEESKLIVIADTSEEKYFSGMDEKEQEVYQKSTLRHEIMHAFLNESGLSYSANRYDGAWAKNEEMVDWFAIQSPKIFEVYAELGIIDTPIPSIPPLQTGALTPRSMIWGDNGSEYLGENAKGATEALKNISDGIRKAAESAKRAGLLHE
nr:MAG TPA: hypothetical protein [Bacteriophage sp.]